MQPYITLTDWVIVEITTESGEKNIHVCGLSKRTNTFRISSILRTFDFHENGFSIVDTIHGSNYVLSDQRSNLQNPTIMKYLNEYTSLKNSQSVRDYTSEFLSLVGMYPNEFPSLVENYAP